MGLEQALGIGHSCCNTARYVSISEKGDPVVAERGHCHGSKGKQHRNFVAGVKLVIVLLCLRRGQLFPTVLCLLLIAGILNITTQVALAEQPETLELTGEGLVSPVILTFAQLQAMEQYQHVYSVINTWPTKKWYVAKGVKLRDLFALAGLKEDAKLIKFISNDGFEVTLTVQELLKDRRYYFPHLMDNHPSDGTIPGSPAAAQEIESILALISAEDSSNPADMNDRDALLLIIGQRVVSEQTNPLFLKYVNRIEVLTTSPPKWDSPKADQESGEVPAGSQVKLSSKRNDMDKVYYTTDGSTPTLNSPMFNKSASRWWPLRPDDLDQVNQPIQISKDTIIKAVTIGPGKLDSDVATFTYQADFSGWAAEQAKLPGGPPTGLNLDQANASLKIGSTIELSATVSPGNAMDKSLIWRSSDTSVATVDNNGLVTVVGPGSAVITVKTAVGNITATCVVNGPSQGQDSQVQVVALAGTKAQEGQTKWPALEPGGQNPDEKAMADNSINAGGELEETDKTQEPVENGRHLIEKRALAAAAAANIAPEQASGQTQQIFEIAVETGSGQLLPEQNKSDIYAFWVLILLFLSGAGSRYTVYTREMKS